MRDDCNSKVFKCLILSLNVYLSRAVGVESAQVIQKMPSNYLAHAKQFQ